VIGARSQAAVWDDVEHGGYGADLELWAELASERGPVLDLGCGAGRVALHLARLGHEVWGLEHDPELTRALRELAEAEGLEVRALEADARTFAADARFGLVLAPMQFVHLFDAAGRGAVLGAVLSHLSSDGLFAAALLDVSGEGPDTWDEAEHVPLPDVRERDGWVFSSLPLSATADDCGFTVERLRQTVSPAGELTDERHLVHLDTLDAGGFESEARVAGFSPLERREIGATDDHVGSTAVILRHADAEANGAR